MHGRVTSLCLASLLFCGVGLPGCTPTPAEPSDPEAETWIAVEVDLDAASKPVRVRALPKERGVAGASVHATASGDYRLGPLPPGDYDVVVLSASDDYDTIHNFPAASVTTRPGTPAPLDLAQPGQSEVTVGFAGPRPPGVMVTAVTVLDGALQVDSHATFTELYKTGSYWRRSRNTITADDPETTFEGLEPGPYTACATVNVGGSDLEVTCDVFELGEAAPAEVALDVEALAGRYSA